MCSVVAQSQDEFIHLGYGFLTTYKVGFNLLYQGVYFEQIPRIRNDTTVPVVKEE